MSALVFRTRWLRVAASGTCLVLLGAAAAVVASTAPARAAVTTTFTNFDDGGNQVVRFDTAGNAVDAHDGEIAVFNDYKGTYFLYGTSYDCGYHWQQGGSRFCGFKVYTSHDLAHWTDSGLLFDPSRWQPKCDGTTYGCFRPHVVFNAKTQRYVLWINSYDNVSGFHVFDSDRPTGPFTEVRSDVSLAVNPGASVGGLNNGDHDVFVDDDGVAYVIYTMWRNGGGDIAIEKLDSKYLSGVGRANPPRDFVRVGQSSTEAPAMFKRNGRYYLTYSDPNRGYQEVGTSYRTAPSPLGPWSAPINISKDRDPAHGERGSCGGQPSFVTPIQTWNGGTEYLYGSDLWNSGRANQALANYLWAPLAFDANGRIGEIKCMDAKQVTLTLANGSRDSQVTPAGLDQSDGVDGFRSYCDVRANVLRFQTFVAGRSGPLNGVSFTSFQGAGSGRFGDRPDAGLRVEVFQASNAFQPVGPALSGTVVTPDAIGWSPRNITVHPNIPVTAGTRYGIRVSSEATTGCYGLAYSDAAPYPGGGESYSSDSGATFRVEPNRSLKFHTIVGTGGSAAVTASSSFDSCCGWSLDAVNDGLTTSTTASMGWSSGANTHADHTEWVQLNLGRSRSVSQVMVFPRSDVGNVGEGFPADFRVELSGDGTAWSTVLTRIGYPKPADGKTFWFTAQPAQYVRLTGTSLRANPNDYGQYRMQLAELSVA